jgi:hypothetical protein
VYQIDVHKTLFEMEDIDVSVFKSHVVSYVPDFQTKPADSQAIRTRIYRPGFGHEIARFRENMPKTLVFNSIRTQRRRFQLVVMTSVPEIIDPVFTKTIQNARFLLSENERFGLVFVKTGSINSGTDVF